MRIALFYNSASGSGGNESLGSIKTAFGKYNIEAEFIDVKSTGTEEQRKYIAGEYDVIAAAGGDGTISSVASLLAGTGKPFGVIPLGTLNHFAGDLKIPKDIEEAVKVLAGMKTADIDIAEVNGYYFVNNSSIGIYPQMVRKRDAYVEQLGTGKWLSLIFAFLKIFRLFPLYTIEISGGNTKHSLRSPFVFIGNNDYRIELYIMGSREEITKGHLSLYFAKCRKRICIIKLAILGLFNKLNQSENFEIIYRDSVVIKSRKSSISVSIDGEVKRLIPPLIYKIHPRKLKVIVP